MPHSIPMPWKFGVYHPEAEDNPGSLTQPCGQLQDRPTTTPPPASAQNEQRGRFPLLYGKVRSQRMSPTELIKQYLNAIEPIEDECDLLVERLSARDKVLHIMSHELAQHFQRRLYLLTTGELVALPEHWVFTCAHVRERRPDGKPYTRNTIHCAAAPANSRSEFDIDVAGSQLWFDGGEAEYDPPRPWRLLASSDLIEQRILQNRCAQHFDPNQPREIPATWDIIYTFTE